MHLAKPTYNCGQGHLFKGFLPDIESHSQLAKMVNLIDLDVDEQSQTKQNKSFVSAKPDNQNDGVVHKQSMNLIDFDVGEEDRQVENAEKPQVSASTKTKVNSAIRTSLVNPENPHWSR